MLNTGKAELRLSGHMGQFRLELLREEEWIPIPPLLGWPDADVDLILDLNESVLLDYELKPFGYFATQGNPAALAQALAESYMARYEPQKLESSSKLLKFVFSTYPSADIF